MLIDIPYILVVDFSYLLVLMGELTSAFIVGLFLILAYPLPVPNPIFVGDYLFTMSPDSPLYNLGLTFDEPKPAFDTL